MDKASNIKFIKKVQKTTLSLYIQDVYKRIAKKMILFTFSYFQLFQINILDF